MKIKNFFKENKDLLLYSSFITIFACIPLFKSGIMYGHDMSFHLSRLTGIITSFQDNQMPIAIYPYKNFGYGYSSPLFYSDLFLIIPALKYTKIIMIILQLISSFALVSNIFYKKHSLYSTPRVQYIQTTDFFPIKSLYKIENDINFDKMDSNKFSIIKTGKYSNQCLENYFIKKDQSCPLTDIIYDNKSSNIYYDYI